MQMNTYFFVCMPSAIKISFGIEHISLTPIYGSILIDLSYFTDRRIALAHEARVVCCDWMSLEKSNEGNRLIENYLSISFATTAQTMEYSWSMPQFVICIAQEFKTEQNEKIIVVFYRHFFMTFICGEICALMAVEEEEEEEGGIDLNDLPWLIQVNIKIVISNSHNAFYFHSSIPTHTQRQCKQIRSAFYFYPDNLISE